MAPPRPAAASPGPTTPSSSSRSPRWSPSAARSAASSADTGDFFLARRRIPWWAACLSFLATEISAVTIISVPATAYSENWEYAQFFIGSSLAKFAVALALHPRLLPLRLHDDLRVPRGTASAPPSQVTGSLFFFVTRLLGSGVRLMAACARRVRARGLAAAARPSRSSPLVSIAYIALGGVKAVVWTNVFQASLFLVGGRAHRGLSRRAGSTAGSARCSRTAAEAGGSA